MKLPLLLALLFGAVSALHLRTKTSNFESPLGDETLPQDRKVAGRGAEETPPGALTQLQEEVQEEGCFRCEGALDEEGAAESGSDLDVVDTALQCPKEDDTVKLAISPGCKTCKRYILVRHAQTFNAAEAVCQKCYRGNLVSIHSFNFNYLIRSAVHILSNIQVWIGATVTGPSNCQHFHWIDGSSWNFAYWGHREPWGCSGTCISLGTRGGHWHRSHCATRLPFVCSY
ncbi:bone marrow proteoglycan [Oryctolagus cuniculus]|uniref:bone marrow proteoglycan n=1 Tax=Oryctolagus cuniculus TaxID=9986 RepID=UPI0001C646D9|nr:bone marrow proteoglycan [Oryctolagus cuniculus]